VDPKAGHCSSPVARSRGTRRWHDAPSFDDRYRRGVDDIYYARCHAPLYVESKAAKLTIARAAITVAFPSWPGSNPEGGRNGVLPKTAILWALGFTKLRAHRRLASGKWFRILTG